MDRDRYRTLMAVLIVGLGAVIAAAVLFFPRGGPAELPDPLEGVFPLPGDVVVRQTGIEIDLPVGYQLLDLIVDGVAVDPAEVSFTEATGDWRWDPGAGRTIEEWTAGDHQVSIRWDRVAGGNPDPGGFVWTFRIT